MGCNILTWCVLINQLDIIAHLLVTVTAQHFNCISHIKGKLHKDSQESQDSIDMHAIIQLRVDELPEFLTLVLTTGMGTEKETKGQHGLNVPSAVTVEMLVAPVEELRCHISFVDDVFPIKTKLRADSLENLIVENVPIESESLDRIAEVKICHFAET